MAAGPSLSEGAQEPENKAKQLDCGHQFKIEYRQGVSPAQNTDDCAAETEAAGGVRRLISS